MDNENTPHTPQEGRQIPLMDATKEQLKAFCIEQGIPVQNFMTEQTMREKLYGKGWAHSFIVVYDDPVASAPKAKATGSKEVSEPMVEVRLSNGEGASGKRAVFVGVNGVGILVPRNIPCRIKHRYYGALRNAEETTYSYDENTKDLEPRDMPSYPFEVIRMPPDAELKAWSDYKAEKQRQEVAEKMATKKRNAA